MKVVSCFDGISCGQVALNRIGVTDYQYFASEIDKHAIKVTQHNFPNTIQMGDVRNLVNIAASGAFGEVDLLMGGSPCQGFSNAGKQLGFVDPRSKLFFDFVAIKNFLKPKWFLLENVRMKKQDQDIISALMGVEPIKINSADFSAQNRVRLYWTNIPVAPWQDRGIVLRDIFQIDGLENYKLNRTPSREQMWSNGNGTGYGNKDCKNITNSDKSGTLTTKVDRMSCAGLIEFEDFCRYLTPVEYERLQTLPDHYTSVISNTQRYKTIGNGWTVDVIAHILKGMYDSAQL